MGSGSRINITAALCIAGAAVIILTIFADTVLLRELKYSYNNTEAIISGIAAGDESGDTLLKYLKEAPDKAWLVSGQRHMEAYGYGTSAQTLWGQKYHAAQKRLICASILFDALILLFFFALAFLLQKQNNRVKTKYPPGLCIGKGPLLSPDNRQHRILFACQYRQHFKGPAASPPKTN